ncbi:MAG: hypothetical protein ABI947_00685 [Chloroflexota bacterium]
MRIDDIDQLDVLNDTQLWNVAADTHNPAEIRQEAIQRWLFPDETDPDADPDDLEGGRLRELEQLGTVLESDEVDDDDDNIEDIEDMVPYFDREGRLILMHDGVSYLIDSLDDEGSYDGISNVDDLYTTDDKTNTDRDF